MKKMKMLLVLAMLMLFSTVFATPKLVGFFAQAGYTDWDTMNVDLEMTSVNDTIYTITLLLPAGTYGYKVLDGTAWTDPNYPSSNQTFDLTSPTSVTWICNKYAQLVMHTTPIVAGNFIAIMGGIDWDPTNEVGRMVLQPTSFYVYEWQGIIPAGTYEFKITLNGNWNQNTTTNNIPFVSDGTTSTLISYNFNTNIITTSAGAPPSATITFAINDQAGQTHTAFYLKGSWSSDGYYDPTWGNGMEHITLTDDGLNGDAFAGDHIFTASQMLVTDAGSNTWSWGVNDVNHEWVETTYPTFTLPTDDPQYFEVVLLGGTTQPVTVTFQVNMSLVPPAIYAGGVGVQGNVLPLDWTNGSNMLTYNGDAYSIDVTFPMNSVRNVQYKFGAFDESDVTWTWEDYIGNRTFTINDSFATQLLPISDFAVVSNDDVTSPVNSGSLSNFPNPFIGTTTVSFDVIKRGPVSVQIYNIKGQLVRSLVNEEKIKGLYRITWDAKDNDGKSVPSGIYLYKLKNGGVLIGKKMVLLK